MSELCNILLDCGEIVWQTIISLSTRLFTNSKNSGKTGLFLPISLPETFQKFNFADELFINIWEE